jgi:hypothetical protein
MVQMYKRLYKEDYESLNNQGIEFDSEIHKAIAPIIERWVKDGYSTIDIEMAMMSTVTYFMAAERVGRAMVLKRKRRCEEMDKAHKKNNKALAKEIWEALGKIPVNDNGEIEEFFMDHPRGTPVEDIWHEIEEDFNVSIVEDLMFPKTEGA